MRVMSYLFAAFCVVLLCSCHYGTTPPTPASVTQKDPEVADPAEDQTKPEEDEDTSDDDSAEDTANDPASQKAPTIIDDFASSLTMWDIRRPRFSASHGSAVTARHDDDADDSFIAEISLIADPSVDHDEMFGPVEGGAQIATKAFLHFGRYEVRAMPAACGADEEVITGIFTYANDGSDLNNNGLTDNNEIDFEFVCSDLSKLSLTVWTDYKESPETFIKNTRVIDFHNGEYFETQPGQEGVMAVSTTPSGVLSEVAELGTPDLSKLYYTYGFVWEADSVRFYLVVDGREIELWNFEKPNRIPQGKSQFMLNVWHSDMRWYDPDYDKPFYTEPEVWGDWPKQDSTLKVDWFKYWESGS